MLQVQYVIGNKYQENHSISITLDLHCILLLLDVCDLQRDTERIIQEHYPGTPEGLRAEIRERVLFGVVLCTAVRDLSPLQMLSCPFLLTVVFSAFAASP